jgi:hypothetical protein
MNGQPVGPGNRRQHLASMAAFLAALAWRPRSPVEFQFVKLEAANVFDADGAEMGLLADRTALDWASANGMPHGDWYPRGRKAEDGLLVTVFS